MLRYCGAAMCALAAVSVLRAAKSEYAPLVCAVASVVLFGAAVVAVKPILDFAVSMGNGSEFGRYLDSILKAVGVSLTVQLASEVCRDMGEPSLGSKLELIGKIELTLLLIPLIKELMTLAMELVG